MRRAALLFLTSALALTACADDRISLSYGLSEGALLRYQLLLRAEVVRTLQDQTQTQEVVATFEVAQEILGRTDGGGSEARITLLPRSLLVDGRAAETGPGQEFVVKLGPDGRVVGIGEPTAEATEELAPLGIERLLPRLRPVLPAPDVSTGDAWASKTHFSDAGGTFSLATESRLAQLGSLQGHPAALVRTTYESPVDRRERFANAVAELAGTDVGAQQAWFALDGFLIRSVGDSVGTYSVSFRPPEGELGVAPVEGALVVRLHTEMRLVETGSASIG